MNNNDTSYPPPPPAHSTHEKPHCLGCGHLREFCQCATFNPPPPFSMFFQQTVASELRAGDEVLVDHRGLATRVIEINSKTEDEVCVAIAGHHGKAASWRFDPGEIVLRRVGTPADNDINDAISQFWVLFYVGEDGRCSLCGNCGYIAREGRGEELCFCPNGRARRSEESPS